MVGWKPRPFIFVHIPKCAGTSIELALLQIATGCKVFRQLSKRERYLFKVTGCRGRQHSKLSTYAKDFPPERYFKFSFVRNPWDRAVSQIEYLQRSFTEGARLFSGKNFKENLWIYCQTKSSIHAHEPATCQLDYLMGPSGKVEMDFVGCFETLEEDFAKLCTLMKIDPVPHLHHAFNANRKLHYSAYYDAESAGWIKECFAKDINHFGYKFEDRALN